MPKPVAGSRTHFTLLAHNSRWHVAKRAPRAGSLTEKVQT
jgi:hypothetical protein